MKGLVWCVYVSEATINQLLLTALLLLTSVVGSFSAHQCPSCGTTPVPYPLSTESTCGDQSYKIRCDAGKLIFDTLNNSYPILSINPSIHRLVIQPANILPNSCISSDSINNGIHLNNSLPFNSTTSNTVIYFNCSALILEHLNCSETSLCRVYLNSTKGKELSQCQDALHCCAFRAGGTSSAYRIRAVENACMAYKIFF